MKILKDLIKKAYDTLDEIELHSEHEKLIREFKEAKVLVEEYKKY